MEKTYLQSENIKKIIEELDKVVEETNEQIKNYSIVPCNFNDRAKYISDSILTAFGDENNRPEIYKKLNACYQDMKKNINSKLMRTIGEVIDKEFNEQITKHELEDKSIKFTDIIQANPRLLLTDLIGKHFLELEDKLHNDSHYEHSNELIDDIICLFVGYDADDFINIFYEKEYNDLLFFDDVMNKLYENINKNSTLINCLEMFYENEVEFQLKAFNNKHNKFVDRKYELALYEFDITFNFDIDIKSNKIVYNKDIELGYLYKGDGGGYGKYKAEELLEKDDSWWFRTIEDIADDPYDEEQEVKEANIKIYEEALKQSKEDNGGNV